MCWQSNQNRETREPEGNLRVLEEVNEQQEGMEKQQEFWGDIIYE